MFCWSRRHTALESGFEVIFVKLAAIQMASGPQVAANLQEAGRLIGKAAQAGARLVVLPENFAIMAMRDEDRLAIAEPEGAGPIQEFLSATARQYGIWIVGGTIPIRAKDTTRVRAACLLFDDRGERVARYDKIHLFDVTLDNGEEYRESRAIEPGDTPVVVDTPFGRLGLTVCYDLRFPELYRRLCDQGVEIIAVPSAFTVRTGRAHWEVLMRARAIENLSYVIASAQGGYHANGRETYGDSMIVSPWGEVLDRLARGSGVVLADMDRRFLETTRTQFPSLQHRKIS
ncbi:MAG: carbon-nitrogen hydrolase family protein [Gammaproteobacteria bacterium]|nr:carbon-nitrogen hydrolase family protein [Gammaproteobacteria bacterium]